MRLLPYKVYYLLPFHPCVYLPVVFSFLLCGVLPALEVQPKTMLFPEREEGTQESSNHALFACIEVGKREEEI